MAATAFKNPFRPGAGHMPPYLAGRDDETTEFRRLLGQETVLANLVLTGLRGVGKTVLLETFKPIAQRNRWLWAGADLSESASVSEDALALRLLTDLAVVTSQVVIASEARPGMGFRPTPTMLRHTLDYATAVRIFQQTPGLVADKLKLVLETAWAALRRHHIGGMVFAYDEAQTMSDQRARHQFPLSVLLDVFQSIQRKGVPFMLVLTGLPTLFPKLVETRTFSERMFRVVFLNRLDAAASRDAISKPIQDTKCPVRLSTRLIDEIIAASAGYPYFIQFICREAYDSALPGLAKRQSLAVPMESIIKKLDADFFAGRWARATDRQRDLLRVIALLAGADDEFTVQEIVECSRARLQKAFSASHVNQLLSILSEAGLVYRNRHGRYSFAVPLFGQFILRQMKQPAALFQPAQGHPKRKSR